jgi:mono/diheme cytochrome c family protein
MHMSNRTRSFIATVAVALLATACGGGDSAEETAAETTAAPTTAAPETTAAPDTTAATESTEAAGPADGMAVYEANCSRCHGSDGSGGRGPSLQGIADEQPDPQDAITQTINGGNGMPSFGDKLSEAEIVAAVDYLREAFPAAAS